MSRPTIFALFMILGGLIALQWHDNYTEQRIAEIDANARAEMIASLYQCGPTVTVAGGAK